MKGTDTLVKRFALALTYLRRARQSFFSLLSTDDQRSPLIGNISRGFTDLTSDVVGYSHFLLGLTVKNSQGEVEAANREDKKAKVPTSRGFLIQVE
jgi:hypothetical protein